MSKLHLATAAVLALAATATPSAVFSQGTVNASNPPITLRYVTAGEFNDGGYLSFGTTFWATNHTGKPLLIGLSAIEVRAGSNWTTRLVPTEFLAFRPSGKPLAQHLLQPHVAGYATPQFSGWPTNGTWRLRVVVSEALTGSAATATRLWRYPSLMERRFRTGETNIPANPFSTNVTVFKRPVYVVSQEISEE
jgi:hypothetical protein